MARRDAPVRALEKAFQVALASAVAQIQMSLPSLDGRSKNPSRHVYSDFEMPDGTRVTVSVSVRIWPSDRNDRGELLLKGPGA